jgi:hypothetical protein
MIIGDIFANLLQVIAVEGNMGQVIEKNYPSPLFHRITAKDLDIIDVEIRSLTGREVPFEFGQVILTLQFKKTVTF